MAKSNKVKPNNFDQVCAEMAANAKAYEAKTIRYLDYSAKVDTILEVHGWDRKDYFREVLRRGQGGIPGVRR
jgi:hypothetical protein